MKRSTLTLTASLVLSAGVLTGCGGSNNSNAADSYCGLLKTASKNIASFTSSGGTPDFTKFDTVVKEMKQISDKAPSEVSADWKTIVTGLDGLQSALKSAGIDLKTFVGAMATGQLPPGMTVADATALGKQLQALQSADIDKATKAIDVQVKKDCNIDLTKVK